MWFITLIDLQILKNPCIPGIKPTWSWCMIFLMCCWTLIAVAKTSKTMLNSNGESGHPCLVPDFRRNAFNFSPLRIMFAVGLSYIAFIMSRYVPSIPCCIFLKNKYAPPLRIMEIKTKINKWDLTSLKDFAQKRKL